MPLSVAASLPFLEPPLGICGFRRAPGKAYLRQRLGAYCPPGEVHSELGSGLSSCPSTWVFLHLPVSAKQATCIGAPRDLLAHHFQEDSVMNFTVEFIPC